MRACEGCMYRGYFGSMPCCDYIFITGHMRPCPPGELCEVKVLGERPSAEFSKFVYGLGACPVCGTPLTSLKCFKCGKVYKDAKEINQVKAGLLRAEERDHAPRKRKEE